MTGQTMTRAFDTALELRDIPDGHEVYGRIVPFGVSAHIRELNEAGQLDEYDELFLPGCTARMRQIAASRGGPGWIGLTVDHDPTLDARLGYCRQLDEQTDGAYGTFRLYDDPVRIDKVRSMLRTSHTGLSIEFIDRAPPLVDGQLRQRRQINISSVTATPIPVYESAGILALRADSDVLDGATPNLDRARELLAAVTPSTIPF